MLSLSEHYEQQLVLKMGAHCRISIVLLSGSAHVAIIIGKLHLLTQIQLTDLVILDFVH